MPDWHGPYQLKVKVISGALTNSTDSKMSPYPVIEVTRGNAVRSFRGPTHKGGHKTPVWNWDMDMYYGGELTSIVVGAETFKVTIWNEEASGDNKIGESAIIQMA